MTLQPALYAMALEALFPEHEVQGGRLYFCTSRGEFTSREVPLDETTRKGVRDVLQAVDGALEDGFLPPVPLVEPTHTACDHCDYRPICGPAEAKRVTPKVRRATSSHPTRARGDDAQAAHGQRLIELELLRRRE
jgi:hypothetical protein